MSCDPINAGGKVHESLKVFHVGRQPIYRLYHPVQGVHFYTHDAGEKDVRVKNNGWTDEGKAFYLWGQIPPHMSYKTNVLEVQRYYYPNTDDPNIAGLHYYITALNPPPPLVPPAPHWTYEAASNPGFISTIEKPDPPRSDGITFPEICHYYNTYNGDHFYIECNQMGGPPPGFVKHTSMGYAAPRPP